MKIVITGAAGMIGRKLTARLIADGTPTQLKARADITPPGERWLELACPSPTRVLGALRELEGALNTLVAHAKLTPELPTQELLEKSLQDNMAFPKTVTIDQVIQAVAIFYHVAAKEITGRSRRKEIVRPRHVAMYLARQETEASLPEIGEALGGRDHTTVLYGIQKIEGLLEQDSTLRREIAALAAVLSVMQDAIVLAVIAGLCMAGAATLGVFFSQGASYMIRARLYKKLQTFSFANLDQMQTGQLMTRLSSDIDIVRMFTSAGVSLLLRVLTMIVGSVVLMIS